MAVKKKQEREKKRRLTDLKAFVTARRRPLAETNR
jgi:hypothetical protein